MLKIIRLYHALGVEPPEQFPNENKKKYIQRLVDALPSNVHNAVLNEVVRRVMNDLDEVDLES